MKITKRSLSFVFFVLFLLLHNGWADSERIVFKVVADKKEYKSGEPILLNFVLQNKGKQAVYVNKRFYLNAEEVLIQQRGEVCLIVTSPSGKKLPCRYSSEMGFPRTDDFYLLEPGKEAACDNKRNLRGYFSFDEPGLYTLVAVYENIYGQEIGLETFKDKVTSKPISIKIAQ